MKVSTPGSAFFHGDSSSDEESDEESKKENNLKKMLTKKSSSNVKEIKAALSRKHKLSPEHDAARHTKNRLSSSSIVGLGHN